MKDQLNQQIFASQASISKPLKAWLSPEITDSDVNALTNGGGTSGIEGTSFLKTGS